jgi:hypothetical protein
VHSVLLEIFANFVIYNYGRWAYVHITKTYANNK